MLDSDHSPPRSPSPRERKVSTKVKKPPPLKKRHTKPCKFFQFGRCSNSADECNFAHVLVVPPLSLTSPVAMSPVANMGGVCNYYAVGRCPSETVCGMRHVHDVNVLGAQLGQLHIGSPPSHPTSAPTPYGGNFAYPSPYSPYPPYYPPWSPGSYGEHPNARPIGGGGYPASNQYMNADSPSISISTSTDSSAMSHLNTPGGDGGPVGALGLTGVSKYMACGVPEGSLTNVNTAHDYDDVDVITEDPQFSEHAHNQYQSRIRVVDVDPSTVQPGYGYTGQGGSYPLSMSPPWDVGGMHHYSQSGGFSPVDQKVSVTRSSSRASSRSKTTKYKTKPCKYFSTENGCPNGDSCTFVHDASIPPVPPIVQGNLKSPISPENSDDRTICSARGGELDNESSEKGTSQNEDVGSGDNKDRKKNFFPITWRVIGGGVLMGGKRSECSGEIGGCDGEEARHLNSIENTAESRGNAATGKRGFAKFGLTALRPRSQSTSSPIIRTRTGGSGKGRNDNLFSAESP